LQGFVKVNLNNKTNYNLEQLEVYIDSMILKGKSKEEIKHALVKSGSNEKTVNLVLQDTPVPSTEREELGVYIDDMLLIGKSQEEIRQTLFNVGWDKKTVESILMRFSKK